MSYVGRFAPSPTGPLHQGSLLAALASYLDARAHEGRWLVRIEDIDEPRCKAEFAYRIIDSLDALGMRSDGPVLWQSQRLVRYQNVFEQLQKQGLVYPCACTRKQLRAHVNPGQDAIYPGTCRNGLTENQTPRAWRLKLDDSTVEFQDRRLGPQQQSPAAQCGDMVVRRADGLFAYQFVVVIDDIDQGISDIVRGSDLLSSTGRQILLQRILNADTPRYLHLPLLQAEDGRKLSKQNGAAEIDWRNQPQVCLNQALQQLGQPTQTGTVSDILKAASAQWNPSNIPKMN